MNIIHQLMKNSQIDKSHACIHAPAGKTTLASRLLEFTSKNCMFTSFTQLCKKLTRTTTCIANSIVYYNIASESSASALAVVISMTGHSVIGGPKK